MQEDSRERIKKEVERENFINEIADKIRDLEEDLSKLYLTEWESEIKYNPKPIKRKALYNKILKIYEKFINTKKKISQKEYNNIFKTNPEWELFDRVKTEYIDIEPDRIKKLEKKYTKEELDAMSIDEIEKLLIKLPNGSILTAQLAGTDEYREIYNAWNRKMYAYGKSKKK